MAIKIGRDVTLSTGKFMQVFGITWFFIVLGSVLSMIFIFMAGIFQKDGFLYFFLLNFGIFVFFTFLLAAYSGIYRVVNSASDDINTREAVIDSLKRSRYVIALSLLTVIAFSAVIMLETGLSMVSLVPYAGPMVMSLLTAPVFILNILIVIAAICTLAAIPPVAAEVEGVKNIALEVYGLLKKEWLNIIFYLLVSIALLILCIILMVFVIRYAGGITKSIQWKVAIAYSPSMKNLISASYFSEFISRIIPVDNTMSALQQYGNDLPGYLKIVKNTITVSFIIVLTMLVSFPLAVYFSFISVYFKKIRKTD